MTAADLPSFIRARLDARERDAPDIHRGACYAITYDYGGGVALGPCNCGEPARVLAWCAAIRAVLERLVTCERENTLYRADTDAYAAWAEDMDLPGDMPETAEAFRRVRTSPPPRATTPFELYGLRMAVRLLAAIWSDHPAFRPEWRV